MEDTRSTLHELVLLQEDVLICYLWVVSIGSWWWSSDLRDERCGGTFWWRWESIDEVLKVLTESIGKHKHKLYIGGKA